MNRIRLGLTAAMLLSAVNLWAQDAAPAAKPDIPALIKQLDSDEFAARQEASAKLTELGTEALPALADAAKSDSPEASSRAFDILRKHLDSPSADLKGSAKAALEKLAAADAGAASRRAADILNPKPMAEEPDTVPMPLRPGIGRAGGFRIARAGAIAIGGPGARRVSVKDADGVREIEVVEDARTVKINTEPGGTIALKVTEKKDGKEETKEYKAKNAEELKKNHPEAHKIYEQYGKDGAGIAGGIVLRMAPVEIGPAIPGVPGLPMGPAVPLPIPLVPGGIEAAPVRIVPPAIIRDPREVTERIDAAQKRLDEATAQVRKLLEKESTPDELKATLETLEKARRELEEIRAKFPR